MRRIVFLVPIITLFAACDCRQESTGIVLDAATKQPIADVSITVDEGTGWRPTSNSDGTFRAGATSGGLCGCPDIELEFEKTGYKTRQIKYPAQSYNDTVYLEKEK